MGTDWTAYQLKPDNAGLHDRKAHHHDRLGGAWPTCPRCSTIAVDWFHQRGMDHLIPAHLRPRQAD